MSLPVLAFSVVKSSPEKNQEEIQTELSSSSLAFLVLEPLSLALA